MEPTSTIALQCGHVIGLGPESAPTTRQVRRNQAANVATVIWCGNCQNFSSTFVRNCFCPLDCNCRSAWRANYCGCQQHDESQSA